KKRATRTAWLLLTVGAPRHAGRPRGDRIGAGAARRARRTVGSPRRALRRREASRRKVRWVAAVVTPRGRASHRVGERDRRDERLERRVVVGVLPGHREDDQ